jgi:hypothetical protein
MREFVGVKSLIGVYDTACIKQEALMFRRIAVPGYTTIAPLLREGSCPAMADYYDDLDWLFEQGIIYQPEVLEPNENILRNEEYKQYSNLDEECLTATLELIERSKRTHEPQDAAVVSLWFQFQQMRTSFLLRELKQIDAYPILPCACILNLIKKNHTFKTDVVQITLRALPVPSYSTPWEQILEYRDDPDTADKYLDLRNWMSDVARSDLSTVEIEEKLDYLMSQFRRHMRLHKMKTGQGTVKGLIVSGAKFAENLIKGNLGKLAEKTLIRKKEVAVMEGELTSPGCEVAYVVQASEAFLEEDPTTDPQLCKYCGEQ